MSNKEIIEVLELLELLEKLEEVEKVAEVVKDEGQPLFEPVFDIEKERQEFEKEAAELVKTEAVKAEVKKSGPSKAITTVTLAVTMASWGIDPNLGLFLGIFLGLPRLLLHFHHH